MRLLRCALALGCLAHSVVNGDSRGLAAGGGLLEPAEYTDDAFASYPLLDESISSAATGTHGFNPATGASGELDVMPSTIDDADQGSAQASGVLEAVRSLEGQLASQQRSLDEIFSASQTRCKDDAIALAQQVALLQGAISQKEQHKKRSHELVNQPAQFIALNKEVLKNLENEYKDAKTAFEHQRELVTAQSLTINTALSTADHALSVLKEAYSKRSDLRVNENAEATQALIEIAALTDLDRVGLTSQRMAIKAALKEAGVETPLEAEVKAEEEAKELAHQSDEQREALASAQADLEQATKAEEKAEAHAAEISKRAEAIRAEVEEETSSLGALSSLVGGNADTGKSASEIAAELIKKESAKAKAQVEKAHQFVREEKAHTKEVRAAVNIVEDKLADATQKRAAMISTSDRLVKNLRAALETVVERLRTQHTMTTSQLHAAKARFDTIQARIEEEAPVLRQSIRTLEEESGKEAETMEALSVRKAHLEKQLAHVREQFVTLASRCESEATDYARRTDARTDQRRQLRILAQHLEVQLTAMQRSLSAAHAAATVHKMHDAMKAKVLFESLKNDAEMDAAAFRGASDIVTEGEGETPFATGGFGMGGLGGPTGLYGRAIHEVETGHAATEKVLHARVHLSREEDQSVQDAAEGAIRAARDMRVLLARDLKLKQQFAREEALEVVRLRKVKAETKEREIGAQEMYDGAREFVAKFKSEVEPMMAKIRELVEVQTGDVTEPAFDRVQGIVTLPEGAPESIRNSTIADLIDAALDMPAYPESDAAPEEEGEEKAADAAAFVEVQSSLRASRRRAAARANSPFEDAVTELRPEWIKYQTAKKRLAALKTAAEKAAYEARMAEVEYDAAMRAARNAAAVAMQASMKLDANKAMWKSLEEYATDVLGMPMPVEITTDPCNNDTAACTPRHENGEAARIMVEDLRKKHALLLRREKVLREIEHKVATARAQRVTRTAGDEEATKLQPAADRAVEDAHKELEDIDAEVQKVAGYIADADAEDLMKSLTQTTDAGAEAVEGAGNAVALVSGDPADTAEKVMNEMTATVPPRSDAANQDELAALRAAIVSKKDELVHAREDLEQQRSSLAAAKDAVQEASESGYKAAMRDAEKLRQLAEAATNEAEARVSRLEETLHKMQGEEEVLAEKYKEAPEPVEEEIVEPEPAEDAPTPVLPAVDTMSKVDAQNQEAQRVTRKADIEAKAWKAGQPVVVEDAAEEADNSEAIEQLA